MKDFDTGSFFFSWTSRDIVKVCSLMQHLVLASNSPCSSFMSLSNPTFGSLSSVTPGYGIWSLLLVPFLPIFMPSVKFVSEEKAFHLKMPKLWVSWRRQARHAYCNPVQMYASWRSVYTFVGMEMCVYLSDREAERVEKEKQDNVGCCSVCLQGPYLALQWLHLEWLAFEAVLHKCMSEVKCRNLCVVDKM